MEVTYQRKVFKIAFIPETYQQCQNCIIRTTGIDKGGRVGMGYKDEEQQLCDVDSDITYQSMLEEFQELSLTPHIYIRLSKQKQQQKSGHGINASQELSNSTNSNNLRVEKKESHGGYAQIKGYINEWALQY